MFFRMILFVWEFVLDLATVMRMSKREKDLEIMLLRQQLRIVEQKQARGPADTTLAESTACRFGRAAEETRTQWTNSIGSKHSLVQTGYGGRMASRHRMAEVDLPARQTAGTTTG